MSATLIFVSQRGFWIGREIEIKREFNALSKRNALVDFTIKWDKGDPRDQSILNGEEREQNIRVHILDVLDTLKELFPEMEIPYKSVDKHGQNGP